MEALLLTKHNGVMRCVRGALKAVTEALVRCHDPAFYSLPGEMLHFLLGTEGVTSNDFYRMLRRSQGLPHAILAVLEAEDPTVPFLLFPVAIRKLFEVARGLSQTGGADGKAKQVVGDNSETIFESQRSNALNVLKFVFEDKVFADRSLPYIEGAFTLATEGFNNSSWYIRNSSLMLYSSVVQRLVGEHPSTGGSGVNTSLHDIAKRTPRGVAFALQTLTAGSDLGSGDAEQPNLALFPILQMLSMLAPDPAHRVSHVTSVAGDAAGEPASGGDSAAMIEAVCRCAVSKNLMIRAASAAALSCLVPAEQICETVTRFVDAQLSRSATGPSLNAVHGTLLVSLQFLTQYVGTLRRNRRLQRLSGSTSSELGARITVCLMSAVGRHAAVLHEASLVNPTVAAAMLTLLHDLLFFAAKLMSATQGQLKEQLSGLISPVALYSTRLAAATARKAPSYALRADVGHMKEAAALVLVVCARLALSIHEKMSEVKAEIARAVAAEAAALNLEAGENNIASWVLDHLHYYCSPSESVVSDSAPFFTKDAHSTVEESVTHIITAIESWDATCKLRETSIAAVTALLPDAQHMSRLGCVAWGELIAHLRCILTQAVVSPATVSASLHSLVEQTKSGKASGSASSSANPLRTVQVEGLSLPNSDAEGILVRFQARCVDGKADLEAFPFPLVEELSLHARPEQPVACREAVVDALASVLGQLPSEEAAGWSPNRRRNAAALVMILVRLLFDDLSAIRDAACDVCSRFLRPSALSDYTADSPRDVMSNVLSALLFLRSLGAGAFSRGDVDEFLTLEGGAQDGTGDTAGEDDNDNDSDGDGGEEDEEVLFNKEADNMYVEQSLLRFAVGYLFDNEKEGNGSSATASRPGSPHFAVFESLLAAASARHSTAVLIGAAK